MSSSPNRTNKTKDVREPRGNLSANTLPKIRKTNSNHAHQSRSDLTNIDHVPSSGTHSGSNAMLYVFEDSEAVIKTIRQGRSPTMRHMSRTHRVALDGLFDRINLDSKNQIRYIDTKHQFADILTKGNFTRDEWNNLLHLFNISHFSSTCCGKNSSLTSCAKTMAKRMQEQKGKERIVAESKSTAMNLCSRVPTSSSSAKSPIASISPRMPIATGKLESRMRRNSKSDATSSSQVRLQDAYLSGLMDTAKGKLVATKEESRDVDLSESETWSFQEEAVTGRPIAFQTATGKPNASSKLDYSGSPKVGRKGWPHNLQVSPATVHHTGAGLIDRERSTDENMTTLWVIWTCIWLFGAYF